MAELRERLEALGAEARWPPQPDLAPRVRAAIDADARPARRWRLSGAVPAARALPALLRLLPAAGARFARRRQRFAPGARPARVGLVPAPLLVATLLLLVVAGGLAAAPGVRSELLQRLGLEHATVTKVPRLPPTALGTRLALGDRFTLVAARERAGFELRMPAALGTPDEAYLDMGLVTFVYGARILFMQVPGSAEPFSNKLAPRAAKRVTVDGAPGLLVEGRHTVVFSQKGARQPRVEPSRLAQTTLLWERDGLLLRLEGDLPEAELLRIARSVR